MTIRIRLMLSLLLMALITAIVGGMALWAMNYTVGAAAELIAGVDSRQAELIGDFSRRVGSVVNVAMISVSVLMIGAALLAAGIAWVLTEMIRRPTRSLRNAMRKFGEGDYTARADVPEGRNDELIALVQTFNEMADNVQAHKSQNPDAAQS